MQQDQHYAEAERLMLEALRLLSNRQAQQAIDKSRAAINQLKLAQQGSTPGAGLVVFRGRGKGGYA